LLEASIGCALKSDNVDITSESLCAKDT
jgi:hypothetical protein